MEHGVLWASKVHDAFSKLCIQHQYDFQLVAGDFRAFLKKSEITKLSAYVEKAASPPRGGESKSSLGAIFENPKQAPAREWVTKEVEAAQFNATLCRHYYYRTSLHRRYISKSEEDNKSREEDVQTEEQVGPKPAPFNILTDKCMQETDIRQLVKLSHHVMERILAAETEEVEGKDGCAGHELGIQESKQQPGDLSDKKKPLQRKGVPATSVPSSEPLGPVFGFNSKTFLGGDDVDMPDSESEGEQESADVEEKKESSLSTASEAPREDSESFLGERNGIEWGEDEDIRAYVEACRLGRTPVPVMNRGVERLGGSRTKVGLDQVLYAEHVEKVEERLRLMTEKAL